MKRYNAFGVLAYIAIAIVLLINPETIKQDYNSVISK